MDWYYGMLFPKDNPPQNRGSGYRGREGSLYYIELPGALYGALF